MYLPFPTDVPLEIVSVFNTLSPKDFGILRLECISVEDLTFLGHVMSSVT